MTIEALFADYQELPEYLGVRLADANQVGLFGDRPVHIAATRGSVPELELLWRHGADLNVAGEHGYTPLHMAVEQESLEAVNWLLEHGARADLANEVGETPLSLAQLGANDAIVQIISARSSD